jgi:hypothetical protein
MNSVTVVNLGGLWRVVEEDGTPAMAGNLPGQQREASWEAHFGGID